LESNCAAEEARQLPVSDKDVKGSMEEKEEDRRGSITTGNEVSFSSVQFKFPPDPNPHPPKLEEEESASLELLVEIELFSATVIVSALIEMNGPESIDPGSKSTTEALEPFNVASNSRPEQVLSRPTTALPVNV